MNKNKGITLIALIVTIIILLILAGVSIAFLTGENGILNKAKTAKEESNAGDIEEQNRLGIYNDMVDDYTTRSGTVTLSQEEYDSILSRLSTLETQKKEKVLWTGSAQAAGTYTFTDATEDISNYKYIIIEYQQVNNYKHSTWLETKYVEKNKLNDIGLWGYGTRYTSLHFIDHGFYIDTIASDSGAYLYINNIIGISM